MFGNDEETDLLSRARAGDEGAFADLISPHRAAVWSMCVRVTGSIDDAEDALQDTLVAAWRGLDRFRADARFSTWLYRIASNAALAVVRRRPQIANVETETVSARGDLGDQVADADRVQSALMMLPESFRIALVLRIYGDLSYDEIGMHQGIPIQTVKSRLWRARSLLHDCLATAPDSL